MRKALCVLLQHNLATYQLQKRGCVEYEAERRRVLRILRYPRYIYTAKALYGDTGELLVEELLLNGKMTLSAVVRKVADRLTETMEGGRPPPRSRCSPRRDVLWGGGRLPLYGGVWVGGRRAEVGGLGGFLLSTEGWVICSAAFWLRCTNRTRWLSGGFAAPSRPFAVLRKVISPRVPPAGQSQWLLGSRWGSVWLLIIIEVIEDVRGLREDLHCGREAVRWRRSLHW